MWQSLLLETHSKSLGTNTILSEEEETVLQFCTSSNIKHQFCGSKAALRWFKGYIARRPQPFSHGSFMQFNTVCDNCTNYDS
jgi:hypothetical protein